MAAHRWRRLLLVFVMGFGMLSIAHADRTESAATTRGQETKKRRPKKASKAAPPTVSLQCAADADCALTTMADGDCCPSLCQPRAVSKKSAEALAKYGAACAKPGGECPALPCAPPPQASLPACVDGRCTIRAVSRD
jgi:hypothetical protein